MTLEKNVPTKSRFPSSIRCHGPANITNTSIRPWPAGASDSEPIRDSSRRVTMSYVQMASGPAHGMRGLPSEYSFRHPELRCAQIEFELGKRSVARERSFACLASHASGGVPTSRRRTRLGRRARGPSGRRATGGQGERTPSSFPLRPVALDHEPRQLARGHALVCAQRGADGQRPGSSTGPGAGARQRAVGAIGHNHRRTAGLRARPAALGARARGWG